jgi:membrane protein DedA with SNARE-associated domain
MGLHMLFSLPTELGYAALFAILFVEYAGAPVPGETALLGAGVLVGAGHLSLPLVLIAAITASILGDVAGYGIGKRGGRRLLLRPGRLVAKRHRMLHAAEGFFSRYGDVAVFLSRWVPGARYLTALTAGAAEMNYRRFMTFNIAGAFVWVCMLVGLSAQFGPAAAATISMLGLLVTGVGIVIAWLRAMLARRRGIAAETARAQAAAAA